MKNLWSKLVSFFTNMTVKQRIILISVAALIVICSIVIPIILINGNKDTGITNDTEQGNQNNEDTSEDSEGNSETDTEADTDTEDTRTVCEKNGHSYGTPTYEWNSDHTECVAKTVCAHNAEHTVSETASGEAVTKSITGDCMHGGTYTVEATFENTDIFSTQTIKDGTYGIGEDGHSFTSDCDKICNGYIADGHTPPCGYIRSTTVECVDDDDDGNCDTCGSTGMEGWAPDSDDSEFW